MVLSERLRRILDRMEDENNRRLFLSGTEPRGIFVRLVDEVLDLTSHEFAAAHEHRFWPEIREIHLMDLPLLTGLPSLPNQLQLLSLRNTGVRHLPRIPETLAELELFNNRDLQILNTIPAHIARLGLVGNGLRELPLLSMRTDLTIQEPVLVEPFRGLLQGFQAAQQAFRRVRPMTLEARRDLLEAQRTFYGGLEEIWSKRKANIRRRGQNVGALRRLEKRPFSRLPESVPGEIASYLSGEPAHASPTEQIAVLEEKYRLVPRGGKRITQRKRR